MQRMLSLGTLVVLGGLSWVFLSEGNLPQGAAPPGAARSGAVADPGAAGSGVWPSATPNTAVYAPQAAAQSLPQAPAAYQQASAGDAIPQRDGPTIRIASFNIQVFGPTKAGNGPVIYTLAEIIRQFDVVAIQEIRTQDDYLLPNFVRLVNQTGRSYDHLIGPRLGNTSSKEQYAFLFDTQRIEADFSSYYTIRDPDNLLHREPLVASFRVRGVPPEEAFTFTLVNVHTDPDVVDLEIDALAEVYRVVRRAGRRRRRRHHAGRLQRRRSAFGSSDPNSGRHAAD